MKKKWKADISVKNTRIVKVSNFGEISVYKLMSHQLVVAKT